MWQVESKNVLVAEAWLSSFLDGRHISSNATSSLINSVKCSNTQTAAYLQNHGGRLSLVHRLSPVFTIMGLCKLTCSLCPINPDDRGNVIISHVFT